MQRQFTATVFIILDSVVQDAESRIKHEAKTLLLFHKKHNKWMPPGGHVEPNETPAEAAKREAFEETGIEIEFIAQENVWIDDVNAKSIPRPHHMLLEQIPETTKEPAHEHIDFIYVARPVAETPAAEPHTMRWFTLEEVLNLKTGVEVFADVQKTVTHLLQEAQYEESDFCSSDRTACGQNHALFGDFIRP